MPQIKDWLSGEMILEYEGDLSAAIVQAVNDKKLFSRAYLSGADLSRADLSRADLSRAYLSGADLSRADLSGAYLSGADLSRANLSRADLSRADLSGAYLSGADLSRANLSRADLSRAYLSGADLIDGGQRSDGYRFVLHNATDGFRICAGCRYFTIEQAREHWANNAEALEIVESMLRRAAIRGFIENKVQSEATVDWSDIPFDMGDDDFDDFDDRSDPYA